jgi:hypothetical protein
MYTLAIFGVGLFSYIGKSADRYVRHFVIKVCGAHQFFVWSHKLRDQPGAGILRGNLIICSF